MAFDKPRKGRTESVGKVFNENTTSTEIKGKKCRSVEIVIKTGGKRNDNAVPTLQAEPDGNTFAGSKAKSISYLALQY